MCSTASLARRARDAEAHALPQFLDPLLHQGQRVFLLQPGVGSARSAVACGHILRALRGGAARAG